MSQMDGHRRQSNDHLGRYQRLGSHEATIEESDATEGLLVVNRGVKQLGVDDGGVINQSCSVDGGFRHRNGSNEEEYGAVQSGDFDRVRSSFDSELDLSDGATTHSRPNLDARNPTTASRRHFVEGGEYGSGDDGGSVQSLTDADAKATNGEGVGGINKNFKFFRRKRSSTSSSNLSAAEPAVRAGLRDGGGGGGDSGGGGDDGIGDAGRTDDCVVKPARVATNVGAEYVK